MTRILYLIILLCSLVGCKSNRQGFRSLTPRQFERAIARPDVMLVDVRTEEEYAAGHIPGAVNKDVKKEGFESVVDGIDPARKTIAVYCKGGVRSKKAAAILVRKGYKVLDLDKGFEAWKKHRR